MTVRLMGLENPVVPGANSVGGKKLKKRSNTLYAVVYQSVDDPHLQTLIQDECNAAITAGTLSPLRKGYMAWEVLKRECSIVNSDLHTLDYRAEFEKATIENTTGYHSTSIDAYGRFLISLNAKIPTGQKFSEDDLALKLLSSIKFPESLAKDAAKEIKATAANREFKKTVGANTVRDFRGIVTNFQALWETMFKQGLIDSASVLGATCWWRACDRRRRCQ